MESQVTRHPAPPPASGSHLLVVIDHRQARIYSAQVRTEHAGVEVPESYTKRRTKASAFSATCRQPLSMVSAWPRLGIWMISVTPGFRACRS
jgi:hypothetical protein